MCRIEEGTPRNDLNCPWRWYLFSVLRGRCCCCCGTSLGIKARQANKPVRSRRPYPRSGSGLPILYGSPNWNRAGAGNQRQETRSFIHGPFGFHDRPGRVLTHGAKQVPQLATANKLLAAYQIRQMPRPPTRTPTLVFASGNPIAANISPRPIQYREWEGACCRAPHSRCKLGVSNPSCSTRKRMSWCPPRCVT